MNKESLRARALQDLRKSGVLMVDGHFDFGNGFHGTAYVNPHQLFRQPSTIWRVAQDLLEVIPDDILQQTEVVAGPVTGGALLAHTMAGLLDSRRSLKTPPALFAPFNYDPVAGLTLRDAVPHHVRLREAMQQQQRRRADAAAGAGVDHGAVDGVVGRLEAIEPGAHGSLYSAPISADLFRIAGA